MTFDRRRSELRLAACAASIYLVSIMKTKLQNLTHTTTKLLAEDCPPYRFYPLCRRFQLPLELSFFDQIRRDLQ